MGFQLNVLQFLTGKGGKGQPLAVQIHGMHKIHESRWLSPHLGQTLRPFTGDKGNPWKHEKSQDLSRNNINYIIIHDIIIPRSGWFGTHATELHQMES